MPLTTPTESDALAGQLAGQLREAIESERYEEALPLLAQYSACVADLYRSGDSQSAPEQQVRELMQWAHRALTTARAHASDQFQLLSDSRVYSASDPDRKTFQM